MNINYVTIKKFCAETGYTHDAVNSKIKRGDWTVGEVYTKAPDGRILINIDGYHKWAETNIQECGYRAKVQLRSTFTTKDRGAVNASPSSPPPLI